MPLEPLDPLEPEEPLEPLDPLEPEEPLDPELELEAPDDELVAPEDDEGDADSSPPHASIEASAEPARGRIQRTW